MVPGPALVLCRGLGADPPQAGFKTDGSPQAALAVSASHQAAVRWPTGAPARTPAVIGQSRRFSAECRTRRSRRSACRILRRSPSTRPDGGVRTNRPPAAPRWSACSGPPQWLRGIRAQTHRVAAPPPQHQSGARLRKVTATRNRRSSPQLSPCSERKTVSLHEAPSLLRVCMLTTDGSCRYDSSAITELLCRTPDKPGSAPPGSGSVA